MANFKTRSKHIVIKCSYEHFITMCLLLRLEQPPHIAGSRQGGDWNLLFGLPRQRRGVSDI